ncbi:molybdopterin dinucleotide binding domain-containing protein, partial [Klebsiella pneumoniae]|uniref:molybdopterin dinucleotide binding domain-containing protein n=1 Tax=Klebsiella pneumoniae TaxID=573 RepID=UPI00350FAAF3
PLWCGGPGFFLIRPSGGRPKKPGGGARPRGVMFTSRADLSDRINPGAVYMTYQWWVGACNELTQDNLDPISKTPETKYCAVKVEAIADQQWAERYAWTAYSDMKARLKAAADV